jgi:MFS family permease
MIASLQRARLGTSLMFFLHGVIVSTWLSRIPAIQSHLRLTPGELGLALLGTAAGAMISMPLTGALVTRLGSQPVTNVSTVLMALGLIPLPLAWNQLSLALALFVFGFFSGAMDVAMNAQAVVLEQRYGRPILSSFHALFSLGGMSGAALGGVAAAYGLLPLAHFSWAVLLYVPVGLLAGQMLVRGDKGLPGHPVFARITRPLLGLGCLAFCILLNEGAMADWSSIYLRRILLTSESTAAVGYAVFSFAMAGGRLAGDWVTERFGRVPVVRTGGSIAGIGLAAGLAAQNVPATFLGFAAAGIGFSVIVPLVFGAAGRHGSSAGAGLAAVTTVGYFGFLVGPALIGLTADHTGLHAALFLVVVLSLIVSALARAVALPT